VWNALSLVAGALTPIARIDISQAGGFGQTALDAQEHGLPALGYVVSYRALQAALDAAFGPFDGGDASRRDRDGGA
jgi:2-polyprenyl-6-methoxyphenol hydroxylase-like FAD-dependent oxidoreductase